MKINKRSVLHIIAYISISMILICIFIITSKSNVYILNTFCLWLLGLVYLSLFLILIFDKLIRYYFSINNKIIILCFVSLITLTLFIILPIRYKEVVNDNIIEKNMHKNSKINIVALGTKNIDSDGYEVWLEGIRYDNKDYNLYNIQINDEWNFIDGRAMYNNQKQSTLHIDLGNINNYELIFRKNQNSGNVYIQIGQFGNTYDLYSKEPIQRYSLDLSKIFLQEEEYSNLERIIFYSAYYIILEIIVFTLMVYIIRLKKTANQKSHI